MLAIGVRNGHEVLEIGGAEDASDRRCRGDHSIHPLTGFSYPVGKEVVLGTVVLGLFVCVVRDGACARPWHVLFGAVAQDQSH
jgi:hypothetical protein